MKRRDRSKKSRKRALLWAGIFAVLTAAVYADAAFNGMMFRSLYPALSYHMMKALGLISAPFPFSLFEVLCTALAVSAVINLALAIKRKKLLRWLCVCLSIACGWIFCFTALWGVDHFGPELYERLETEPADYTVSDLYDAAVYCTERANEALDALPKDADGRVIWPGFKDLGKTAKAGLAAISSRYEAIYPVCANPKPLLYSDLLSYMGFTGFFFCYTAEACISTNTYPSAVPLTMTHELSHSICIASEDEANFLGFLACLASGDRFFEYSAWYTAYIWCVNSLYDIDRELSYQVMDLCSENFRKDLNQTNAHYDRYEGKTQEVAQTVNDVYLKAYQEELGVESYDAAVSYLVAWYMQGCPIKEKK